MNLAIIQFPAIDPVLFSIGPVDIRWYGISYVVGIALAWWVILRLLREAGLWKNPPFDGKPPATAEQVGDLVMWAVLGIVLGGRLGWVLIYGTFLCLVSPESAFCGTGGAEALPWDFVIHPWRIFMIWQGGMSFHGGLAGVMLAVWLYCRNQKIKLLQMGDLVAAVAPIGLFFGRVANFINGELYGRPTDVPWAMVFPQMRDPSQTPRHPSQLYEAFMEGILLFILLQIAFRVLRAHEKPGQVAGLFFLGYGTFRFIGEFFREPDGVFIGPFSMGMVLSIPLWIAAFLLFQASFKKSA